jgi:peptide/nickel transport system substrate-binding protein
MFIARLLLPALLLVLALPLAHAQSTLTIALTGDPGPLDPARSGNYVDRNVFAALCDKLIDTDPEMNFVPQLATGWAWSADNLALTLHLRAGVHFQDGSDFDAAAVQANLQRAATMTGSLRRPELRPVTAVDVDDPLTVTLHLSTPYAPLLALLADRSGMMLSPTSIAALGADVSQHPVCAGPYSFTGRVAQDHITLDRFAGYWNAASVTIGRIVYRPITDSTVRLVNLQTGQVQIADQIAPTDAATVQRSDKLVLARHTAAAYRTLQFNLDHGPRAKGPLGQDPRVRLALAKSIDRAALNQVVFNGLFVPNNQTQPPHSLYWDPDDPVPERDLAGARALLAQAGVGRVTFTLQLGNNPIDAQIGQVIQSMAAEAGFDITLSQVEGNAGTVQDDAGDFDAALLTWSGRADPDANLSIWMASNGPFNFGHYDDPKMDALLAQARATVDPAQRVPLYRQVVALYMADVPQIILYNYTWLWGVSDRVAGFVPNEDGLIRVQGLKLAP